MEHVTIIDAYGCDPRTENVELRNAATHIKDGDRLAVESEILLAYYRRDVDAVPIAWKYTDPTEEAKLIYSESMLAEIKAADPSLIVTIDVVEEEV